MAAVNIIPTDGSSVFDVIRSLSTLDQQAIIRPNNPPPGVAGYLFDIVGDDEVTLTSEITDHYVENNTAIQDQISLKPEEVKVSGMVAELVQLAPTAQNPAPTSNPLPFNAGLVPVFTEQAEELALQAQSAKTRTDDGVTSGRSLYGYYNDKTPSPNITRQSKAFQFFYQLWKGRQLFSVETPWGFFTNMAISSCTSKQSEDTKWRSDFDVTFKKIRFAQDITVNVGVLAGRAGDQRASTTENGNAGKSAVSETKKRSLVKRLGDPK